MADSTLGSAESENVMHLRGVVQVQPNGSNNVCKCVTNRVWLHVKEEKRGCENGKEPEVTVKGHGKVIVLLSSVA